MKPIKSAIICLVLAMYLLSTYFAIDIKAFPNVKIGVISSTIEKQHSYIDFYNVDWEHLETLNIPYGGMPTLFDHAVVYDDILFTVPQGLAEKDLTIVFQLNLLTSEYSSYDLGAVAMSSVCPLGSYIFTTNNFNGDFFLRRYDINSHNIDVLDLDGLYVDHIKQYFDKLFVFGVSIFEKGDPMLLLIIDPETMVVEKRVDLSEYGSSIEDSVVIEGFVYAPVSDYYISEKPQKSSVIVIDNEGNIIERIDLKDNAPFQILEYKGELIITHYDIVQCNGKVITKINPLTKQQTIISLQNEGLYQALIFNDFLYTSDGEGHIFIYTLPDFELVDQRTLVKHDDKTAYYYMSSFFIYPIAS
jgi:hypothetical protein